MSIHVISDSTCDLPEHIKKEFDIRILPLHVRLGDDDRLDGVTITPDEIYSWSDQTKETPKTAAPSPEEVMNLMKDVLKDDPEGEIIAFSISDVLSASGNIMRMVAEELEIEDRVHVVNSRNLSIGVGILAMCAAKGAKEGKSVDEILKEVDDLIPRLRVSFVLDTLTYLHRGGRCSGVAAFMGTKLKLHVKIVVENGTMRPDKKYRGNMNKVIPDYVSDMDEGIRNADKSLIFVVHSGVSEDVLESMREHVRSLGNFERLETARAGSVISSHCGPGVASVIYIEGK